MNGPARESPKVLIAERDERVRELQQHFLERAGYVVEFADDGETAFRLADEHQPALVISEILIPKLDGLALCRQLRSNARTSTIPVIIFSILSAHARAREAGAQAFLRKPLIDSVFLATVRDVIAAQPPGIKIAL
jgi:DNA-binding response OmpR family regulator